MPGVKKLGIGFHSFLEDRGGLAHGLSGRIEIIRRRSHVAYGQLHVFEQTAVCVEGGHVLLDVGAELGLGLFDRDLIRATSRNRQDHEGEEGRPASHAGS